MINIRSFIDQMNSKGIPVPMVRYNGKASMSMTLVWISTTIVIFGLLNRFGNWFKGVDITNALQFAGMCYAYAFGRGFQTKSGNIEENKNDKI